MKKIVILLISAVVCGSVYSADDIFKRNSSLLILNNKEPHHEIESSEQFDFFESMKQQEQDLINQRNYDLEQAHQTQQHTSNMSPHDKSQYYLEHRHFDALNALGHEQQFNSMLKAKNKGLISEKDYQQKIVKQNPLPSAHGTNQLRFSIPIGE
ncbi:hypothetical protein KTJ32_14850 [Acinetobacter gyllenbergii]|uniref:hypothetical protein n=1 Tax=Acinetobacter gyllenbergii TaxID=134534 RepID=UPI0021D24E10|nr:hypothetical protein [Acinetobacter gyllenbergii]MCU4582272.1 hypothetical protein [Acinetobacter gyllenbergii]